MTAPTVVAEKVRASIESHVEPWPTRAASIQVIDQDSLEGAASLLSSIKALMDEIAKTFDPIDRAQIELRKVTISQRKKLEEPLVRARDAIARKIGDYRAEVERKAREERERIEREEREERERVAKWEQEERLRLEAEAKAAREAAEKAAEQAKTAEAASAAEAEKQRAAELEAQAEAAGEREAEALIAPPMVEPSKAAPVKAAGIAIREIWKYEVTDLRELARAVAVGAVPIEAIQPADGWIGPVVRASKGTLSWPGVRVYSERSVATR